MRASTSRLAKQVSERFLTPGNPTGLTGLRTHAAPRPALINIYNRTLKALESFPKDSAYRASVEALTKHRLSIIENVKPEGYDAWFQRMQSQHPEEVKKAQAAGVAFAIEPRRVIEWDERDVEWDNTGLSSKTYEGPERPGDAPKQFELSEEQVATRDDPQTETPLEVEPALTAEQVNELETKFGAGLLEEVIEVAKGELELVSVMHKNKVWEELAEKSPEGQWSYFERSTHTKGTPKPSQ